jgi:hypothetical protein
MPNPRSIVSDQRKIFQTTVDIANMHHADTIVQQQIEANAFKASKENKNLMISKEVKEARKPEENYNTRMNNMDYVARAKMERLGVNARLTPEELVQRQELTRPEQAEIEAYENRIRQAGKVQLSAEILRKPVIVAIPSSEDEWDHLHHGGIFSLTRLQQQLEQKIEDRNVSHRQYERYIKDVENTKRRIGNNDKTVSELQSLGRRNGQQALQLRMLQVESTRLKNRDLPFLVNNFQQFEGQMKDENNEIELLRNRIKDVESRRQEYINRVKQDNKRIVDRYADKMKQLQNLGINLTRFSGESDEDYFNRISIQADALTQDEMLQDGNLFIIQQFLNHMKTLGLPLSSVENINQSLDPAIKEYILLIWKKFKIEFHEHFGDNLYRLANDSTYPEVINLIQQLYHDRIHSNEYLQEIQVNTNPAIVAPESVFNNGNDEESDDNNNNNGNDILNAPTESVDHNDNMMYSNSPYMSPMMESEPPMMSLESSTHDEREKLLNKITQKHNLFWNSEFNKYEFINKKKKAKVDAPYTKQWDSDLQFLDSLVGRRNDIQDVVPNNKGTPVNKPRHIKVNEDEDDKIEGEGFRKLGSKHIHYKNLIKKNKLDIRQPSKSNISGFPVASVSDLFKSLVVKLVEGKSVLNDDIKQLNSTEEHLYKRLLGVTGKQNYHDGGSIDMKARLKLIEAERQAENDNKQLLAEAKEILLAFARQGVIEKKEATRFFRQLERLID